MAQTLRNAAFRAREDLYVVLIECLECGAPAGTRCRNLRGQSVITCCGIRAELAKPMARAILQVILLLRSEGYLTEPDDLPAMLVLDLLSRTTRGML
jgi:hypothetical protein